MVPAVSGAPVWGKGSLDVLVGTEQGPLMLLHVGVRSRLTRCTPDSQGGGVGAGGSLLGGLV